jgi:hypothetical protein
LDAETDGQKPLFRRVETDTETGVNSKSPRSAGQMHGFPAEFDAYRLGGGDDLDRTGCSPPSPSKWSLLLGNFSKPEPEMDGFALVIGVETAAAPMELL